MFWTFLARAVKFVLTSPEATVTALFTVWQAIEAVKAYRSGKAGAADQLRVLIRAVARALYNRIEKELAGRSSADKMAEFLVRFRAEWRKRTGADPLQDLVDQAVDALEDEVKADRLAALAAPGVSATPAPAPKP